MQYVFSRKFRLRLRERRSAEDAHILRVVANKMSGNGSRSRKGEDLISATLVVGRCVARVLETSCGTTHPVERGLGG